MHIQAALGPPGKRALYYQDTPAEIRTELWRRVKEALEPLRASGKLGLLHFQFPPWLRCNREGHAHVEHCVDAMAGYRLSVEFRQRGWFEPAQSDSNLAFQRELGVVYTVVEGPQGFDNSVPALWCATHATHALMRLHGRNAASWDIQGASAASARFNDDYPDSELDGLSAHIKRLAQDVLEVHVVFNNNMQDQGQRNAASLARRLFALSPDVRSARLELRPGEWRQACKERRGFEATNRAVR